MPSNSIARQAQALATASRHPVSLGRIWRSASYALRLGWAADRPGLIAQLVAPAVQAAILGGALLAGRSVLVASEAGIRSLRLSQAVLTVGLLLGLGLAGQVAQLASRALLEVLRVKTSALALRQVTAAAAAADLAEFEDPVFHDRVEQARLAAQVYISTLLTLVTTAVSAVVTAAAVTAALAVMTWWLPLPVLAAAVPSARTAARRQAAQFRMRVELLENQRVSTYLTELLTGRESAKEVRAFALAGLLGERLSACQTEAVERERSFQRLFFTRGVRARLAGDLLLAAVIAALLLLSTAGHLDTASAVASMVGVYLLAARTQQLTAMGGPVGSALMFVEALRQFIHPHPGHVPNAPAPAQAPAGSGDTTVPGRLTPRPPADSGFGTLEADKITFTYPTASTPAVSEVCLTLRRGQIVGLVGENGSGKTTLAKLLAGLYQPTAGSLLWNGRPVEDRAPLRNASAVLFQDFTRYKLPAADNIGLGRTDRIDDHQAVAQAARRAEADQFLSALADGYNTVLSTEFTGGADLSLGQWQRVALARVHFRDAPFIVLDEPSAALDPSAEAELFAKVRELYEGRTVLLITHRFSTIRHADAIYVLQHGRIIERGTHNQLIDAGGNYARMYHLQANTYLGQ